MRVQQMGLGDRLLGSIFLCLVWILNKTYRFRYGGVENQQKAKKRHPKGAYCLAVWHEFALPSVLAQQGTPHCILISPSRDGGFVDLISRKLGFYTSRGSSSRGGVHGARLLHRYLAEGVPAAFTADGPRGPRHKCKPGVIRTAMKSGCCVLPVSVAVDRAYIMRSWDQNCIPKPFAKIVFQYGEPIFFPPLAEGQELDASYTEKIEAALEQVEKEALATLKKQ
jgi:lysophospholipid acyltransferase (LPLAT)-like uncharacterized protein